ncbi:NUDIX hydrolase [Brevundimonas sp. Leaf363]|uniref:NUDIX hydrolase n=1 Tax=Brevundimonas sp. Leaf363 TaxID=1736353 RepID=UPI0006F7DEB8|nr:NUDIX hydrolase [Brevundimonas sp. Leaf363]KQS53861.1 NUDIX hydrolase [Brevundimonas sp. Leaf363]
MTDPVPEPAPPKPRRQVAALPWRMGVQGLEVLLVTSRDTGRWVTPKGGRMAGLTDAAAAAQEALEEAGVEGCIAEAPLGEYHYLKRLKRRAPRPCVVSVYPLEVQRELADWKERAERDRRWMSAFEAADAVEEADLAGVIRSLNAWVSGR